MESPAQATPAPIIATPVSICPPQIKTIPAATPPKKQAARDEKAAQREITTLPAEAKSAKNTATAAIPKDNQMGDPNAKRTITPAESLRLSKNIALIGNGSLILVFELCFAICYLL